MKKHHKFIQLAMLIFSLLLLYSCTKKFNFEPFNFLGFNSIPQTGEASETFTIAIDPGHGGVDTGAGGIIEEVGVNEKTANFLYDFLMQDPHFLPVKTRNDGEDLSNTDRTNNAEKAGADLLISIHANKDSHASSNGFECYATPPGREHHEQSLKFANAVVNSMGDAGARIRGETGIRYMYYINHSKKIVDSTDLTVRDSESFGMLEKASCPAILVEQCFLSNQSDVDNWASEEGCKKSAYAYYLAICDFFGTKPVTNIY